MSRQSRKNAQRNAHTTLSKIDVDDWPWPSLSRSCCHCWTAIINKCALVEVGGRVFSQISGSSSICGNCSATLRKCALKPAYSPLSRHVEVILRAVLPKTEQNRCSSRTASPNFSLTASIRAWAIYAQMHNTSEK